MGVAVSEITIETSDGHRQRDRELAEQTAHDAAHQQQRNEDRDQRDADGKHRESDLLRALQRGLERAACHVRYSA